MKSARDHLAALDKTHSTSVVDDLDLTNVLAKTKSGGLESPNDVLMAIRTAWQAVHASNVAANRPGTDTAVAKAAVASESRLADALLCVHQCWLEEHLAGTVVNEDDFTAHVVAVNYKCVKTALASMANWSQRHTWEGFVPAVKAMREDIAEKTDGPYRTYAQIETALSRVIAEAAAAVRADEDEDDPELFLAQLERWVHEKWTENGLPELKRLTPRGAGNEPGRRDKRARYKEASDDDDFDEDVDQEAQKVKTRNTEDERLSPEHQRSEKTELVTLASGVQLGGPLPAGASVCPGTPNAVVVKIKCHELQATVMVVRPRVFPTESSAFVALPPPPPASPPAAPPRPPADAADAAPSPSPFGGDAGEFPEPPPAPASRYVGPPTEIRVLTVAGVAVNDDTDESLASPEAFEAHALEVADRIAAAGGPKPKRLDPPTSDGDPGETVSGRGSEYFRANAFAYEREGVWVRFYEFESKLVACAAAATAAHADTPSTKVVDGVSVPGVRSGAVGGSAAGGSGGGGSGGGGSGGGASASARRAREDMDARFGEMRERALTPAGLARAETLRAQIKALDAVVGETRIAEARVARDASAFGELGRLSRRRRGVDTKRDTYAGYCEVVDRGISLASRALLREEERETA